MSSKFPIKNYYPNAMVVFVSGFQNPATNNNTYSVSNLGEVKEIKSISVELTVRNSPSTFSLSIFHKANKLMIPDQPDKEISSLYNYSNKKKTLLSEGKGQKNSKRPTTTGTSVVEPGNYYDYKDYNTWLESDNFVLEDTETKNRYPVILQKTENNTTYWSFDFDGNILKIPNDSFVGLSGNKTISITYKVDGTETTKPFVLYSFKNSLFTDLYKDTIHQGLNRDIFLQGKCRIQSMDRVIIFMSERFTTKKNPDLIKCFTGLVNNVEEGYSEGHAVINITGEDITKYMKVSLVNVNPALLLDKTTDVLQDPATNINAWSDIFKDMTTPDIIRLCTIGGSTKIKDVDGSPYQLDGIGTYTLASTINPGTKIKFSQDDNSWVSVTEQAVGADVITKVSFQEALGSLFTKNTVHICNPYSNGNDDLVGFRPYAQSLSGSWSFYQGDWKTRREIAYRSAEDSHFVFYADRNGEIWFHPPRFSNAWILGAKNPNVYVIDTPSIINYGFIESDDNIFTVAFISTEPPFGGEAIQTLGAYNKSFRDDGAIMKYGFRIYTGSNPIVNIGNKKGSQENIALEALVDSTKADQSLIVYAKSILQRLLAQKYQGQITLVGRAELDPGRPVYIPVRNMIYYVETVQHQQTPGEGYTTTLHLSYGRKPWELLPELITMAANDEIYMTDAALYDNAEVNSDSAQKSKKVVGQKTQYSKSSDSSIDENIRLLKTYVLSPIEYLLNIKLTVTNIHRTKEENDRVGGKETSQHLVGKAADILCSTLSVKDLYLRIKTLVDNGTLVVDRLIYEGDHVHVSYNKDNNRNMVFEL